MASKPLSNNNKTPRNKKATPNPAKPTPISENMVLYCVKIREYVKFELTLYIIYFKHVVS